MKKLIAFLLVAVMALSFAACSAKNPIVGTWALDFEEAFANELGEDYKELMEMAGVKIEDYVFEFEFKANGSGRATVNMGEEKETHDFTYTAKDGKLTMSTTVDGETEEQTYDYKIEDNNLSLTLDGETQILKRK